MRANAWVGCDECVVSENAKATAEVPVPDCSSDFFVVVLHETFGNCNKNFTQVPVLEEIQCDAYAGEGLACAGTVKDKETSVRGFAEVVNDSALMGFKIHFYSQICFLWLVLASLSKQRQRLGVLS